ncbi:MAG TPA: hypothetical protein VJ508_09610 [Saprospiraceae bacterium]|nr:hypothetical protein [Saprospiraceae bacterium]
MKRNSKYPEYPYYEVMKDEGHYKGTIVDTLEEARKIKKQLKKEGNDAFIFKVSQRGGVVWEDVVR